MSPSRRRRDDLLLAAELSERARWVRLRRDAAPGTRGHETPAGGPSGSAARGQRPHRQPPSR